MKGIFIFILFALTVHGQKRVDQTNTDLLRTHGYCIAQDRQLDHIAETFPALRAEVFASRSAFAKAFGPSCDVLDVLIPLETKQELKPQIDSVLSKTRPGDIEAARAFLKLVGGRAGGDIHSPVKEILLALSPEYSKQPEEEFKSGFTRKYVARKHPKSKGVDFSIRIPFSWKFREGKRSNIVQVFNSRGLDDNAISVAVSVSRVPLFQGRKLTDEEAAYLFVKDKIRDFVQKDEQLVESGSLQIQNQPAGFIVTDSNALRSGILFYSRTLTYMIYFDGKIIYVNCIAGGLRDYEAAARKMDKFKPLFSLMVSSLAVGAEHRPAIQTKTEQ
ncbi:MAG: hypothetical protein HKN25_16660 [Pyrinomonadaceae bacterium]|nr:hypothetical protein [Pyrinomonadaceae bacterium]